MTASLRETERDWVTRAACRGHDPEMWYPTKSGPSSAHTAVKICRECPVRDECLSDAESRNEPFGIWGGKPRRGTALGSPHRKTKYQPEPTPGDEQPGTFASSQCMRCGQFWMHNAGAREHFSVATKQCPECVALLPSMPWGLVR